ncbi:Uncharacterized protein FKW44_017338, partial [Caligus rogercresseyi]
VHRRRFHSTTTAMETSTPKSRSSTPSNNNNNNATHNSTATNNSIECNDTPPHSSGSTSHGSDLTNVLQQAMLSSSKSGINPMMLQMAQLQGMNPLLAMNLHPPLIPPVMLSNGNSGGSPNSSSSVNLLSQFQGGALPSMMDSHSQLLSTLGFDPKLLNKSESLIENSKRLLGGSGLDPKILSMFAPSKEMPGGFPPSPLLSMGQHDPKLGPDTKILLQLAQGASGLDPSKFLQGGGSDPSLALHSAKNTSSVFQPPEQQKRARTRITDEQLKVLRVCHGQNVSADGASPKGHQALVPKHAIQGATTEQRLSLQLNNPPSTLLNLEEYEKTGESKVTPLNLDEQKKYADPEQRRMSEESSSNSKPLIEDTHRAPTPTSAPSSTCTTPGSDILRIKKEEHLKSEDPEAPPVSGSSSLTLSNILGAGNSAQGGFLASPFSNFGGGGGGGRRSNSPIGSSPGFPDFLGASLGGMSDVKSGSRSRSPSGKRANRTRFTDYQIKVLQEFFENNAYPKDDDLEYLSKLLSLSPRVIVVWFQNARQKARKIYENQPPLDPTEDGSGRFTRTPGLNYQCKKCLLVFQRYYELIRHQKQHCFKEEDAKRSAQAQKAAAVAAAQFSGPLLLSCMDSPMFNQSTENNHRSYDVASEEWPGEGNFSMFRGKEEEKKITPSMFDQLIREDPFTKFVNRHNLFPNYPPVTSTPYVLNTRDQHRQLAFFLQRKLSEDGDFLDDKDDCGQPRDKRLRTTILPEQLDFLYQKYQVESNPSRKMLEQIANEVGLRKRVVQVWFQNTRARERKGQFRAHQQVINKRCPYCPALFKVRSALESHLATKHSDQYTRGEINIDSLPDAEGIDEGDSRSILGHPLTPTSSVSGGGPIGGSDLEVSMRKYYEDTMKRYMNDLQSNKRTPPLPTPTEAEPPPNNNQALDLTGRCLISVVTSSDNQLDSSGNVYEEMEGDSCGDGSYRNGGSSSKRFRTQMSSLQVKMMKSIFTFYKTPTMNECAELGRQIGLQKRVVQVWFQNARAKEKKARLSVQQATGTDPESPRHPQSAPSATSSS